MGKALKFLLGLNCFITIMGVGVLIASGIARSQTRDDGWGTLLLNAQNASSLGIVTGLFTLGLSLIGCVGAAAKQKRMLCCYLFGLMIVLFFQIGAAVAMTNYANALQIRDERGVSTASSLLTFPPDIAINNAAFSAFMKCCSGCPSGCNNTTPGSYVNATLPNCAGNTTCHLLTPCDVALEPKCFIYPKGSANIQVPPLVIPDTLCSALGVIWVGTPSHPIVGPADKGSCGKGDPIMFLQDMDTFVGDSLFGVAAFFTFVAVMEGLALLAGLYLLFCAKQSKVAGEDEEQVYV
jgi:hypothetical protein